MVKYLPLLNLLVLAVIPYLVRHEKEHTRLWLLMRQICVKLHIEGGD